MFEYEGRIYRPPGEAHSLLVQLTIGCSHNRCAFCAMYRDKRFRVREVDEVLAEVRSVAPRYPNVKRIFLCDGNALATPFDMLAALCRGLRDAFPGLRRIGTYYNAGDVLRRSPAQLEELRSLGLSLGYLGLESGSDDVLDLIHKGTTASQMLEAVAKTRAAGILSSIIALTGVGGRELSQVHVDETARVLNAMQPRRLSFLSTVIVPGTPLHTWTNEGRFHPLTDRALVRELRSIVDKLRIHSSFRANHVSNQVALEGRLPKDRERLLAQLDRADAILPDEVNCIWTEAQSGLL